MKTILKVLVAFLIAAAAVVGFYALNENRKTHYIDIYDNYKEEDE